MKATRLREAARRVLEEGAEGCLTAASGKTKREGAGVSLFGSNGWRYVKRHEFVPGYFASLYLKGECRVLVAQEQAMERGIELMRWHLSISCIARYPTWDEIHDARYSLLADDLHMAMILPPKSEHVNVHSNCFHLHEIPQDIAR